MTYEEYAKSKSTKQLIEELNGLNSVIDQIECFGTRDLILRDHIEAELQNRKRGLTR